MKRDELKNYRTQFPEEFILFFKNNNFIYHDPLPLKIDFDKTLSFTNSTTCIFKYYKLNGRNCFDYITVQNALRTNTYATLLNNNITLLWNAHLTMLGGYINSFSNNILELFEKNIYLSLKFLKSILGENQIIIITIPSKIKVQLREEIFQYRNLEIIFLKEEVEDLIWEFGLPNISGIGVRWELKNGETILNCGNHIIMYEDKKPIGIDFGFGLEVLIQAKLNLSHKILASTFYPIFRILPQNFTDLHIKIVDALATYITMTYETNFYQKTTRSINRTATYYLRAIQFLKIQIPENDFSIILESLISTDQSWIKNKEDLKLFILKKINNNSK